MLHELHIRNLGVIEEATAEFSTGLSVVTGETGAGKTMVVSSLRLLSGHRADASRVRNGADKASVEGIFSADSAAVDELVEQVGGYVDDGEVIASRTVNATGRSRAHLAGKTVAAGVLGEFAGHVITIHGQNDQLRLLDPVRQLGALDDYAGLGEKVVTYQARRAEWLRLDKDLRRRMEARRDLALESETLQRAVEAIDEIDPQPGEDVGVKAQIKRLQAADEIRAGLQRAQAALDGMDGLSGDDFGDSEGASALVGQAANELANLTDTEAEGGNLSDLADRLGEVSVLLADISSEIGQALLDVPDPDELDGLLQRQTQLRELRKYAVDVDGALAWRDQARERLESMDVSDEALQKLQDDVAAARDAAREVAEDLSSARVRASKKFSKAVTEEIRGLHMSAEIRVDVRQPGEKAGELGPHGIDEVEFQLVQGGNVNPLAGSASGGELSRVMLALEVVLAAGTKGGRTMVFDEVDAGVGGKAAVEIGRRLAKLAVDNQVIVVTHLPQVAAFGDAHVYVAKATSADSVTSSVRTLSEDERVEELSRMLAGLESETGRAHAEELMAMATEAKAKL
ncbi:DNA repair protein RecN [Corynebacterium jeikeium]|jgi:DNA repair protein RecN (Recombination protein N)|uniref:DNA repair protein RecN n=1 Tax=Corynebacterium jeikeium TaxID=38289 RepID=UPI0001B718CD|nr:DNA repair protein RecN [Corynebacterium jeikeium]EEW16417.1 DNA repair protein RecN [Corynebacterium jeikeium ATCC 43734]OOD34159.1 DNA repair protein RecN [Corynebacterium jeikeium]WCZ53433.1 DNA repair protein RecN [Corynebacterium jeikeium]SUY81256.1 recombination and DNA repair [Corynebacterium jeikeium]